MNIPFVKPDINEDDIKAVTDVLKSGWITTGPVTKQFEKELAIYMETPKAVCLNSQTAGAELILRLLGIGPGDEVIVPAYTYTASCSVIRHVGATPVMVDCQKDSPQMDYDLMEAAITEKTKVIIPVDLAGVLCDYQRIYQAIKNQKDKYQLTSDNVYQKLFNRVIVLADTAHSLGAELDGVKSGNLADFSSFSFHAVKNLTTAEGGAVTWKKHEGLDDEKLYHEIMLFALHGQTKDALEKTKASAWEYDIVDTLYKCNLPDITAALGYSQFQRYPQMLERRAEIIRKYDAGFAGLPITTLNHFERGQRSSGHLYFLKINNYSEKERNDFINAMGEKGIFCNVHYKPLPMLTAYKNQGFDIADFPNAFHYYENMVTLPIYSTLTDEEVDYIIDAVRDILG